MYSTNTTVGASPRGDRLESIKKSPNYVGTQFVNTIPEVQPRFFKSLYEWVKGADHTTPEGTIPVVSRKKEDFLTPPESGLRITWFGHSNSLVEIDGKRVLLDPMWGKRSSPFSYMGPKRFFDPPVSLKDLPPVDAVLISHDHYDHLDRSTIEGLSSTDALFIVPLGVGSNLELWGVPPQRIVELDWWQSTQLDDLTITATPARHFSGRSMIMVNRNKTLWAGFAMAGPMHRVYYSGDTGMFEGFEEIGQKLGPFDASLMEVGAYHQLWADLHLGPEQAVEAHKLINGGLMIPVHWATFDLALHSWTEPVERLIAAAGTDVPLAIPRPGQSVEPAYPLHPARWWPDLPWQTADDHPVVSSGLKPRNNQSNSSDGFAVEGASRVAGITISQ